MEDSTTYQYILDVGRLQEARKFLLRQGRIRFGAPDAAVEATLESISDLDRLERLGDQLLTVSSWQELLATP